MMRQHQLPRAASIHHRYCRPGAKVLAARGTYELRLREVLDRISEPGEAHRQEQPAVAIVLYAHAAGCLHHKKSLSKSNKQRTQRSET